MKKPYTIPTQTRIGQVHLKVSDIERSLELYWDKPKEVWNYNPDGTIIMFSHVLGLDDLLKETT